MGGARTLVELVSVDGINNIVLAVNDDLLAEARITAFDHPNLMKPSGRGRVSVKVGAAGTRYLGDVFHLGQNPRAWPNMLNDELGTLVLRAVPHAQQRIETMRNEGKRPPWVVYSNDLARVRQNDPDRVSAQYRASASSGMEYEALVRQIKQGGGPVEVKADRLADVVLLSSRGAKLTGRARPTSADRSAELSPLSKQFLSSGRTLASLLGDQPVDWSGPTIGICKAFESEAVSRLLDPLCQAVTPDEAQVDLSSANLRRVARYCARKSETPPELGGIRLFLETVARSRLCPNSSPILNSFFQLAASWPDHGWLIEPDGAAASLATLTKRFRNRAAHIAALERRDYNECEAFVAGPRGILWQLIDSTSPAPTSTRAA
jgi:hypothetical protein